LPPKKPPIAPSSVPIAVASSAADSPTRMEISAPLMAFASTSRPSRSAPKGRVSARGTSAVLNCRARSAHSA
jgi:hypothetical protein